MKKSGVIKAVITILIILLIVGCVLLFYDTETDIGGRYSGVDRDTKAYHKESGCQLSGNSA